MTKTIPLGLIDRYRDRLPIGADTTAVTLGEGSTPLIPLKRLGQPCQVYVKFEGLNPTGSFKDRGMTMAVTRAAELGAQAVICASTGNTSAAAAAYAARAGMQAFVLIPEGKIARGKLAQAVMHGARILQIRGNFDDGMSLVKEVAEQLPITIVNSVNPYRLQGQKTAAFEIIEALGQAPDVHCLPVGNAGNITAHWIGYTEATGCGTKACSFCEGDCGQLQAPMTDQRPTMVGYQANGSAPFLRGAPVAQPDTVATAIRIGNPQSWDAAHIVQAESGGWFDELSDQEILNTQRRLASEEGVFCEPASAASLAGALRDIESGRIAAGSTVVCTLTGHGLKDPDIAAEHVAGASETIDATLGAVEQALGASLDA